MDGFGCGHTARYISQYPWKRSQFGYGGLQEGIFTLWLCVCACVCVCVCVRKHQVAVMMVQRVRQDVGTPEVKKMGEKRKIMREMKWNLKKHAEKHHTKEDCGRS